MKVSGNVNASAACGAVPKPVAKMEEKTNAKVKVKSKAKPHRKKQPQVKVQAQPNVQAAGAEHVLCVSHAGLQVGPLSSSGEGHDETCEKGCFAIPALGEQVEGECGGVGVCCGWLCGKCITSTMGEAWQTLDSEGC